VDGLVQFMHDRFAAELEYIDGYDGSWNDADGCWGIHVDPDFTRADVEAKRQILDKVVPRMNEMDDQIDGEWGGGTTDGSEYVSVALLRLLALPYADHPDYRPEWRP
jgi:hypothetical protein